MSLLDLPLLDSPPMAEPEGAVPVMTFTAEQVADAVAAALDAHNNGDDPRQAALAAITDEAQSGGS